MSNHFMVRQNKERISNVVWFSQFWRFLYHDLSFFITFEELYTSNESEVILEAPEGLVL